MTTVSITNYYFEELKNLVQDFFNLHFEANPSLSCEILMKNSRTYYLKFNENLNLQEIENLMNYLKEESLTKNREVNIEVYSEINNIEHKFYFSDHKIYVLNTLNQLFRIEDSTKLIQIDSVEINYHKNEIPSQKLHSLEVIHYQTPKKTWWKFWKN